MGFGIDINLSSATKLENNLSRFRIVSFKVIKQDIATAFREEIAEHFQDEQDASGNKWERLAQSTVDGRKREGVSGEHPILQVKRNLYNAAINPKIDVDDNVFMASISNRKIARIAEYIENGTSRQPARSFFRVGAKFSARITKIVADAQAQITHDAFAAD